MCRALEVVREETGRTVVAAQLMAFKDMSSCVAAEWSVCSHFPDWCLALVAVLCQSTGSNTEHVLTVTCAFEGICLKCV